MTTAPLKDALMAQATLLNPDQVNYLVNLVQLVDVISAGYSPDPDNVATQMGYSVDDPAFVAIWGAAIAITNI